VESATQFQPPRPRGLDTEIWVQDYNEMKVMGVLTGSSRTDDQTNIGLFWSGFSAVAWGEAAQQLATQHHLSRAETARVFAILNIALADSAITAFRAKRDYAADPTAVTWRPLTAIRLGGDGNPRTPADANWQSLLPTPAHPEYAAAHPYSHGAGAA